MIPRPFRTIATTLALTAALSSGAQTQSNADRSPCTTAASAISARDWLARAADAIGLSRSAERYVLHTSPTIVRDLADQSDRAYPPFMRQTLVQEHWFDPRDDAELHGAMRPVRDFNPWTVIADWQRDSSVRVAGRCRYLDYDRIVLSRRGALAPESLYIDPASAFPMMLRAVDLHYFLGPVHEEYRYTAWDDVAPFTYYPSTTIRLSDGLGEESWSTFRGKVSLVPRDNAPAITLPDTSGAAIVPPPRFGDQEPDTVRVGAHTFLLVNRAFTSVVSLMRDTVFVIDATAGEQRARRDSAWVGRLFPGRHPVTLVLLSAVWPHIAGLRFWVASGARVVGYPLTGELVRSAVARRWTEHPDALERRRASVRLRFTAVRDSASFAGGALKLYALDGAGNESMLMAYLSADGFLWASDRVQAVDTPSLYTTELVSSVKRAGLTPRWTSGPHFKLVPWSQLEHATALPAGTP